MRSLCLRALVVTCVLVHGLSTTRAQVPVPGHSSKLVLDEPIGVGAGQTLSGRGAPIGIGVFVELWRVPPGSVRAESVASVEVELARRGTFLFENVDVTSGETYYVTLSRSWHFDTPGDSENWLMRQNDLSATEVSGGTLKVTIDDVDGNGSWDPWFMNFFNYDSSLYKVVEIRMRNPSPNPGSTTLFGIFWGWTGDQVQAFHLKDIRKEMGGFETFFFPMNIGERLVSTGETLDGMWYTGVPNNSLRLDPINGFHDPVLNGTVFEIDTIRLREDYRLDFHVDGDRSGIGSLTNIAEADFVLSNGFLSYTSPGNPSLDFDLAGPNSEFFETAHFTRFVIGVDTPTFTTETGSTGVRFGAGTEARFSVPLGGRHDLSALVDSMTDPVGLWSTSTGVELQGIDLLLPDQPADGTPVRIDYIGFTSTEPFGPSAPVVAGNAPPVAEAVCEELAPVGGQARLRLDGSGSSDPDNALSELTFEWSIDGTIVCTGTYADCGTVEVSLAFGTHTVGLRVTDPDGAFGETSKSVTLAPGALATFSIDKAKVHWGDTPPKIKVSGEIGLPLGLNSIEVTPIARLGAGVALTEVLQPTIVNFTVHGSGSNKWKFHDDTATTGIRKFDIDWKGARYHLKDDTIPFELKSHVITSSETVLSLKLDPKEIEGLFVIDFGGLALVEVEIDGSVTADPTVGVVIEKPGKEATITLPFALLPTTVISATGSATGTFLVADDLKDSVGRFRVEILFDGDFPAGVETSPRSLSLDIQVGDQGLAGAEVLGPDELEIKGENWKKKK